MDILWMVTVYAVLSTGLGMICGLVSGGISIIIPFVLMHGFFWAYDVQRPTSGHHPHLLIAYFLNGVAALLFAPSLAIILFRGQFGGPTDLTWFPLLLSLFTAGHLWWWQVHKYFYR